MRNGTLSLNSYKKKQVIIMPRPRVVRFFNYFYDSAVSKNKQKCQAFGMQFVDQIFRPNNVVTLYFRKVLSRKAEKVTELAEEVCAEVLDKYLSDMLALLVKDLVVRKVAVELNVEK